jgi:hypothetical protein
MEIGMVANQQTGFLLLTNPYEFEDKWYYGHFVILDKPPITNTFVVEVLYGDVIEHDGPVLIVERIKVLGYVRCEIG